MATPGPSTSGSSTKRPRMMQLVEAQRELERMLEEDSNHDELLSDDSLESEGEGEDFPPQVADPENWTDFDAAADAGDTSESSDSDTHSDVSEAEGQDRPVRGRGRGRGGRGSAQRLRHGEASGERGGRRRGRGGRGRGGVFADLDIQSADNFQPTLLDFGGNSGLREQPQGDKCLDFFSLFITDHFVDQLVIETNRYAQQTIQQMQARPQQMKKFSRFATWRDTNTFEMKQFLGLTLLMGIVQKPSIESYWSKHALLNTNIFPLVMTRNRYQLLLRFLHCNNNEQEPAANDPQRDRLYKVRPVIDHLQEKFQNVYKPDKFIAVDESLLLYKGQLIFKQYIPMKRARFGIKLYHLCEDSGYTYKLHIYTGKQDPFFNIDLQLPPDALHLSMSGKIVVFMMADLLDKGYRLFMDNWYSVVNLYRYLYNHGTVCCGTARENCVPHPVRALEVKNKGDMQARRCDELLFVKWMSSKVVYLMSTMHDQGTATVRRRRDVVKPKCVIDYNSTMGAVDKADMMLQPYSATRKTFRWYKKMVIHLIQISMLNAFLVHQKQPGSRKLDFLQFQLDVIQDLLFENQCTPSPDLQRTDDTVRLFERHFPSRLPRSEGSSRLSQKRCQVCSKQGIRKDSTFCCEKCPSQPGLCIVPCFEIWHTKLRF